MSNTPVMEDLDEASALAAELRKRTAERDELAMMGCELRAERDALAERLRQTPTMRDVVSELRSIHADLAAGYRRNAREKLAMLLRRLDESQ